MRSTTSTACAEMSALRKMSFRMAVFLCLHAGFRSVTSETEVDWHFKGPNIALNKSTTQYPGTYVTDKNYTADLAVDGITDSDFSKGSCTHTSVQDTHHNATLEVNLGGKFFVTGINIFNREDFRYRLNGFRVRGFADNQICPDKGWCEIFDDATLSKYEQLKIQIILDGSKPFKKIAIELPTAYNRILILCEVQIFAASCKTMNISDGQMLPKQSDYAVYTKVDIRCNTGYKPEKQVIKCNENRKWDTFEPCKEVKCARPEQPEHGYYLLGLHSNPVIFNSSSLPYDNIITGKCDLGYQNENFESRTCQFNETWSGVAPNCTKIQCPYPKSLTNGTNRFRNGSLYQSGLSYYNTTVKIRCNTGYYIVGNEERTCNANQTWSGETRCSLVTCSLPQKPDGGFYEIKYSNGLIIPYHNTISNYSERAFYNTTVTLVCDEHFELVSPEDRTRRCTEAGVWDKESALCAQATATKKNLTSAVIGGIAGVVMLLVIMISGLAVYMVRRRKRNLKDQEEFMTYNDLRRTQSGPSNDDYADLNVTELEKEEKPAGRESAVYCNETNEL